MSPLLPLMLLLGAGAAIPDPYTYLWWADGWRGRSEAGERRLMAQTSLYAVAIDVEGPRLLHLGALESPGAYLDASGQPNSVVTALPAADLQLLVTVGGVEYRCVAAAGQQDDMANFPVRIIESGRILQRFDILHLRFENDAGDLLDAQGRLEVVVWPDRLHLILEMTPDEALPEATLTMSLTQAGHAPVQSTGSGSGSSVHVVWQPKAAPSNSTPPVAPSNLFEGGPDTTLQRVHATDTRADHERLPVSYDSARGWWYIDLPERSWDIAADPDRLDRFGLVLENPGDTPLTFPLLFAFDGPFTGITGLTPILRDSTGNPTGIPVQISKNWHRLPDRRFLYEGPWFHGFSQITLPPGGRWEGELAIAYAHWGGVPAASHAQLSLIGWGTNQLWEQVAIGSWGESICYDPDVNLNRSMIDDIRPLMVTGMRGGRWNWTHNVGGGDFLVYHDEAGKKQYLTRVRTAHLAYGPNLTGAVYAGVSADGRVAAQMHVSTPRCDDVNRAYHRIRYDILAPTPFSRLAFYQLGADAYNDHQFTTIARGNLQGLAEEWQTDRGGKRYLRGGMACEGEAPWFSLHGGFPPEHFSEGAWANRGLVIRSWNARLGGETVPLPFAAVYGTENGPHSANIELVPPPGLEVLQPGDFVEATLELLVIPIRAEDYYGPNQAFRDHLKAHEDTWQPIHRLAAGNHFQINMKRGTLVRSFPMLVEVAQDETAELEVQGGMGFVPITFTGLQGTQGYQLEHNGAPVTQEIHGNDFWQTTREADGTYSMTFNISFDTSPSSGRTLLEFKQAKGAMVAGTP